MLVCEMGFSARASFCDGTGTRAAPLVLPQRWANWLKARTSKSRNPGFCFQLKLKPLLRFERSHLKYPPSISPWQQPRDPSESHENFPDPEGSVQLMKNLCPWPHVAEPWRSTSWFAHLWAQGAPGEQHMHMQRGKQ